DPGAATGVLASLSSAVERTANEQRERILREFSLDNKEGALARLVAELTERHARIGKDLEDKIDDVVGEFSLDDETSALSRLVRRVEQAEQQISSEFSLDEEDSALARMRRELLGVLAAQQEATNRFQSEVLQALTAMTARKQEADRSTRHGETF